MPPRADAPTSNSRRESPDRVVSPARSNEADRVRGRSFMFPPGLSGCGAFLDGFVVGIAHSIAGPASEIVILSCGSSTKCHDRYGLDGHVRERDLRNRARKASEKI